MQEDGGSDISWRELAVLVLIAGCGIASAMIFAGANPGWDRLGEWPAAAWLAAGAALACIAGFLAVVYRYYLRRRYGRLAPVMLAAFIALHVVGALLLTGTAR